MSAIAPTRSIEPVSATAALRDAVPGGYRFYWIDWLRFLAATTVLFDHLCNSNWLGDGVPPSPRYKTLLTILVVPTHLGREAVTVFFVLSGALVGGLTLRKIRAGTFDVAAYATDRFTRIWVPLVPALLLTAASVRMLDDPLFPLQYVGCLLGLNEVLTHHPYANGALWSLAYEIWCYVFAGGAAVLVGRKTRPAGRLVALAVTTLALYVLFYRTDWTYFGAWLIGAGAIGLSERIRSSTRLWVTLAGFVVTLLGVFAFGPELVALVPPLVPLSHWSGLRYTANLTIAAGAMLFVAGVCRWSPSSRFVTWIERWGTTLAAFSYTLYLTHMPVLRVLASTTMQLPGIVTWYSIGRAAVWVAICVAVALVMYGLFEAHTPRIRRWLRARLAGGKTTRASEVHGYEALAGNR